MLRSWCVMDVPFESGSLPRGTAHPPDNPVLWTNKRTLLRCLWWHSKSWNELSPKTRDGSCVQYMMEQKMAEMERVSGLKSKTAPFTYRGQFPANVLLNSSLTLEKANPISSWMFRSFFHPADQYVQSFCYVGRTTHLKIESLVLTNQESRAYLLLTTSSF